MSQMYDAYERMIKMNTEIMEHWGKALSDMPWMKGSAFSTSESWNPWVEALRSGYQIGVSNWNNIMDQSLEVFLKSLRETKSYRQTLEQQIRDNWEELKKGQQNQQEKVRQFFGNLADLLREESAPTQ
jgi:hypothetical protein